MLKLLNKDYRLPRLSASIDDSEIESHEISMNEDGSASLNVVLRRPEAWRGFKDDVLYIACDHPSPDDNDGQLVFRSETASGDDSVDLEYTGTLYVFDEMRYRDSLINIKKGQYTLRQMLEMITQNSSMSVGDIPSFYDAALYNIEEDVKMKNKLELYNDLVSYYMFRAEFKMKFEEGSEPETIINISATNKPYNGVKIQYGHSTYSYTTSQDITDTHTAILPYGAAVAVTTENEWGVEVNESEAKDITLKGVEFSKANGDPFDKPADQLYIVHPNLQKDYGYADGSPRIQYESNSDISDPAELAMWAWRMLEELNRERWSVSATVDGVGYRPIGEIVRLELPRHNDEALEYPIVTASYDMLNLDNSTYEIGKPQKFSYDDHINKKIEENKEKQDDYNARNDTKQKIQDENIDTALDTSGEALDTIKNHPIDALNNSPEIEEGKKLDPRLYDRGGDGWDYIIHADDEDKTPYMTFKGDSDKGEVAITLNADVYDEDKTKPDKNKPLIIYSADGSKYLSMGNYSNSSKKYTIVQSEVQVEKILRVGYSSSTSNRAIRITNENSSGGTRFAVAGAQTTGTGYAKTETPFAVNGFRYDMDYNTEYSRMLYITPKRFSVNGIDLGKFPNQSASQYYLAPNIDITAGNHVNNLTMAMAQLYGKYSLMLGTDLEKVSGIPKNLLMYMNGSEFKVASTSTSLYLGQYTANSEEVEGDGRITFKNDDTHYVSFARVDRTSGDAKTEVAIVGAPTTSTAANVTFNANNVLCKVSSSKRYKQDLEPVTLEAAKKLLDVQAMTWYDKAEVAGNNGSTEGLRRYPGLIAEHLHEAGLQELVEYNADGEVESILYDRIPAHMLVLLQKVVKDTESMEKRIKDLETSNEEKDKRLLDLERKMELLLSKM